MKPGDILTVYGNNQNGYKTGSHLKLKKYGAYPNYKTEEKMNVVKYPTYPEVPSPG